MALEPEPGEQKIAPKQPSVAREPEPEEQKMAPEQPIAPTQPVTAGPLRPDTLIPRDESAQPAPPSAGKDQAATAVGHRKPGHPKGNGENLVRGEHWRDLRRPKLKGGALSTSKFTGAPSAHSSWFSQRNVWAEWEK